MSILEKMIPVIVDKLSVSEDEITLESAFKADLGADSLDLVELVMGLEEEFNITIPEADMVKILTVKDAVAYVTARQ
ncbi:MAG TPA: acyl carrier protein, partial [Bacillota bacterium]|nr:acyl carrier protein [Bacillota bacterium]